jgi:glycosyltransferase involved in cell wall biosynthesis
MTGGILASVAGWPDPWVLLLHERYGRARAVLGDALARHEPLLGRKIFISESAADMVDDLGSVLAGVDAGLAFYEPDYKTPYTGKNLQQLGTASGKVSTYLRYGVPVILNDIGLFPEEARRHGFGHVADGPGDIGRQLDACADGRLGANARRYFAERLDFNLHAPALWSRLLDAMAEAAP